MRLFSNAFRKAAKRQWPRWLLGFMITLSGMLYTWGYIESNTVARMDNFFSGLRMRLEPAKLDPRIVIVDIDGKSLNEVGRFPWPRNVQAKLVEQLVDHYEVGVVGYDISFPEPDLSSGYKVLEELAKEDIPELRARLPELKPALDYDGQFASAMIGRPVVLGFNMSVDQKKGVLPKPLITPEDLNGRQLDAYNYPGYEGNIPVLQRTASGAGSFSVLTDPDGIVRTAALIQQNGDKYYPSLSLATFAVFKKAVSIKPKYETTFDQLSQGQIDSGGVDSIDMFIPGPDGKNVKRAIVVGEGMTNTVHFRGRGGPAGGAFRYVSAVDVLTGDAPKEILKGTIVLVGTTAPGLVDLRATPVNPEFPGVEIHANVVKSMLDHRFKHRNDQAWFIEMLEILLIGLALTFALAAISPLKQVLVALGTAGAALGMNYYQFNTQDQIYNVAALLIVITGLFLLNLAWGYFGEVRKGRALVNRFGEYVAPELVAEMADDPDKYNMDGESRELTVMFVDVRGFTTISEGLTPKALREYINLYLTAMSEDIRGAYRGTLDKYIGDAVMAFWGAPVSFPDHASRGVATSLLMQQSAKRLNEDFKARNWPELKIGIGLNTGMMHVGDMGSAIRKAYTVMGDAVNLGSRLEGITKVYGVGITVGEATRAAAPEFVYRELDLVRVKGKNEPVAIFEPLGLPDTVDDATREAVARWHEALACVRAQQWDQAQAIIDALQAARPHGLYTLYTERIAYYRANPPGGNWDGVTTFETK
jgi:adenylate cyclase